MTDLHKSQDKARIRFERFQSDFFKELQKLSDNFGNMCKLREVAKKDPNRKQLTDYMEEAINERSK